MPQTDVYFYQDHEHSVPVLDWFEEINRRNRSALNRCQAAIEKLKAMGHELRRPSADYLRDDIYELRIKVGRVNYRLLYFFHGRNVAIVAHGLTKEKAVPVVDIDRAVERKLRFIADPDGHTYKE